MAILENEPKAFGAPGIPPRWTRSAKDIVGTAYSTSSRIWYTASAGVVNEIYFPTIDLPQVRDLQFLVSDGESFFHDERRDMISETEYLDEHGLGVRITSRDRADRYQIIKEIIADPHQPCLLIDARLEGDDPAFLAQASSLCAARAASGVGGWGNNGNAALIVGHEFLTANKNGTWLALGASVPFVARSCGYVGTTDGWQDLNSNYKLDYQFAAAEDGNIALIGELDLSKTRSFTLGLGRSGARCIARRRRCFSRSARRFMRAARDFSINGIARRRICFRSGNSPATTARSIAAAANCSSRTRTRAIRAR